MLMAGTGSIFCVIIVFVQEAFGSVTEDLGLLGVFLGGGLFLGTVLYGKYGQKLPKIRTMFISFALCGVLIDIFAFYAGGSPVFLAGGLLIMLIGAAAAPVLTCANTLIHVLVPDEVRGRIFSSMEAVMHLAFLLFMFLTAWLSRFFSNLSILAACGTIFALLGIAAQFTFRESV
jgi:MFS family permease